MGCSYKVVIATDGRIVARISESSDSVAIIGGSVESPRFYRLLAEAFNRDARFFSIGPFVFGIYPEDTPCTKPD